MIEHLLQQWAMNSVTLEEATEVAMAPLRPLQNLVSDLEAQIREAIKTLGKAESENAKAWITDRKSVSYDPTVIREQIPEYAEMVIEETVNKKKVTNLLKASLVSEEQLKPAEIVSITQAFYLRRKEKEAKGD